MQDAHPYTNRHIKVAGYIHWMICEHIWLQVTDRYYENIPERVIHVIGATGMWDVPVIADRTVLANQPDTVLHDKKGEDSPAD